jgi:hypothetical protein
MPNKRTGMDYLDYSGSKPKKKKGPSKLGLKKKKKKNGDERYNPFTKDGKTRPGDRTPTSASQTTGP